MRKLIIQQNQVNYVGLFSKPAFSLWGNGARILEELYKAFSPYKVSLADFRQDYLSPVISDTSVTVFLGSNGNYKFKFDRVEVLLSNFTEQELTNFPDALFIQFLMQSGGDKIDYWETAATGRELLDNALAKIGLEIKKED